MKEENIICVPVETIKYKFDLSRQSWPIDIDLLNSLEYSFLYRPDVENDYTQKQLIPYAIVVNHKGEILCYQRAGSEQRLKGIRSAGIGGHVNDTDRGATIFETLKKGLIREFEEEIGISITSDMLCVCGMINEEETNVGHCHTGIVFRVNIESDNMQFDSEISNPTWILPDKIDYSKFELWSSLAIKLILGYE